MKRHRHTVAYAEAFYFGADFDNRPPKFMAGHSRDESSSNPEPGPVVLPQVPVAAAYTSQPQGLNDRVARA